jgi:hypothetical protein
MSKVGQNFHWPEFLQATADFYILGKSSIVSYRKKQQYLVLESRGLENLPKEIVLNFNLNIVGQVYNLTH